MSASSGPAAGAARGIIGLSPASVKPRRRRVKPDTLKAIIAVSPSLVAVGVFIYAFIAWTGYISLSKWNDVRPNYTFAGLTNYIKLFNTDRFLIDIHNTIVFTVLFLASCLIIGFVLAVLLDQKIKGEVIFRTIFLLPFAVSLIATGVAWRWLESPNSGLNVLFKIVGLGFLQSRWFSDPNIGIAAVVLPATWQLSGYVMALYLAGLRSIPSELLEAAAIDGADSLQRYRYVVIPLLWPVTITSLIILGNVALKIFDLTSAMTGSGPAFADDVPAYFMFQATFQDNNFAEGASIAILMLIFSSLLVVPYLVSRARGGGEA
ncbi:MAG: carbohydrate ABC transporter permease [Candidatus Dormibacteraceae bacterium]